MKEHFIENFKKDYSILDSILKRTFEIKVKLEEERGSYELKIGNLEDQYLLTENQENTLYNFKNELSEIDENLEQIEDYIELIEEAMGLICFDLESLEAHTIKLKQIINRLKSDD